MVFKQIILHSKMENRSEVIKKQIIKTIHTILPVMELSKMEKKFLRSKKFKMMIEKRLSHTIKMATFMVVFMSMIIQIN